MLKDLETYMPPRLGRGLDRNALTRTMARRGCSQALQPRLSTSFRIREAGYFIDGAINHSGNLRT